MHFSKQIAVALLVALPLVAYGDGLKIGTAAPSFDLTDQNGKSVKLSDLSGKIVVLEWFNDACPFVKKQYSSGAMNVLAAKYGKQGVSWLAVNSTFSGSVEHNRDAGQRMKIDRPILDDHAGRMGHDYGATNTPQMIIIDAAGKIAYNGAIDSVPSADPADLATATNYVSAALDDLLAGKTVQTPNTNPYGCTVKYETAR